MKQTSPIFKKTDYDTFYHLSFRNTQGTRPVESDILWPGSGFKHHIMHEKNDGWPHILVHLLCIKTRK